MNKECVIARVAKDVTYFGFLLIGFIVSLTMIGHIATTALPMEEVASSSDNLAVGFMVVILTAAIAIWSHIMYVSYRDRLRDKCGRN